MFVCLFVTVFFACCGGVRVWMTSFFVSFLVSKFSNSGVEIVDLIGGGWIPYSKFYLLACN